MIEPRRINGWAIAAAALVLCGLLGMLAVDRIMRDSALEKAHGDAVGDARIWR